MVVENSILVVVTGNDAMCRTHFHCDTGKMTAQRTRRTVVSYITRQLLGCILVTVFASTAHGTSVRAVTMAEMLGQSALVFEGRVVSLQARQDSGTGTIHTYVIFKVLDVLKGEYSNNTIELSFLGGTVGGTTLAAGDMQMLEKGEKGIYFVESLQRRQAHPLYGWSQGHFVVVADERGVERVLTQTRRPVVAMQYSSGIQRLSDGIALGVTVTEATDLTQAMTITDFKQQLSTMLRTLQ